MIKVGQKFTDEIFPVTIGQKFRTLSNPLETCVITKITKSSIYYSTLDEDGEFKQYRVMGRRFITNPAFVKTNG